MSVNKKDIVQLLESIAVYMELKGENSFKISAFRKAAQALELSPVNFGRNNRPYLIAWDR